MILGTEVFSVLENESGLSQKSVSSHWREYLKDFNYEKDESFSVKGLDEGRGGRRRKFQMLLDYIFQTPYRVQGKQFSTFKKILQHANEFHKERNTSLKLGTLRHALSLALIEENVLFDQKINPILVIGDGYGVMSSLLLSYLRDLRIKVVVVNLTQNLLIDAVFIKKSVPLTNICLIKNSDDYHKALKDSEIDVICIQADNANLIGNEPIGIAINIASMQEMEPPIIAEYFHFLRNSINQKTYFYCSNRLEKILPDGTVVNYLKYPWHSNDQLIVDELCPWHHYFYNYYQPPFYFPYGGPVQHRLVLLNKTSNN